MGIQGSALRRGVAALALAVTLSACGGDSEPEAAPSTIGAAPVTTATTPTSAASTAATPSTAAAGAKTAVNKTISDDALGHTIVVKSLVRGFAAPSLPNAKDKEVVLVEVQVTTGKTYLTSVLDSAFRVIDDKGTRAGALLIVEKDMTAAGYPRFKEAKSGGQSGAGWMAFSLPPGSKTLTLRYNRLASNVIGGGATKSIPAKDFDVALVP